MCIYSDNLYGSDSSQCPSTSNIASCPDSFLAPRPLDNNSAYCTIITKGTCASPTTSTYTAPSVEPYLIYTCTYYTGSNTLTADYNCLDYTQWKKTCPIQEMRGGAKPSLSCIEDQTDAEILSGKVTKLKCTGNDVPKTKFCGFDTSGNMDDCSGADYNNTFCSLNAPGFPSSQSWDNYHYYYSSSVQPTLTSIEFSNINTFYLAFTPGGDFYPPNLTSIIISDNKLTTFEPYLLDNWKIDASNPTTCAPNTICIDATNITTLTMLTDPNNFECTKDANNLSSCSIDFNNYTSLTKLNSTLILDAGVITLTLTPRISNTNLSTKIISGVNYLNVPYLTTLNLKEGLTEFAADITNTSLSSLDFSNTSLSTFTPIGLPTTLKQLSFQNIPVFNKYDSKKIPFKSIETITFNIKESTSKGDLSIVQSPTKIILAPNKGTTFTPTLDPKITKWDTQISNTSKFSVTLDLSSTNIDTYAATLTGITTINLSTTITTLEPTLETTTTTISISIPSKSLLSTINLKNTKIQSFSSNLSNSEKLQTLNLPPTLHDYSATLNTAFKKLSLPTSLHTIDLTGTTIAQLNSTNFSTYKDLSSLKLGVKETQYNFTLDPSFPTKGLDITPSSATLDTINLSGTTIAQLSNGADFSKFVVLENLTLGPDVVAL